MLKSIIEFFYTPIFTQSSNIFYIGRKKIPIAVRKTQQGYTIKLGSGFASYTLDTTSQELSALANFINSNLK
jgi:hypothetical protein